MIPDEGDRYSGPAAFEVLRLPAEDEYRLVVRGELDLATAPWLTDELMAAERDDPSVLTLDLSGLSFMDVAGMRVLLNAARRAKREGWRLVVLNPQPQIRRLFALTAVDRSLEIRFR